MCINRFCWRHAGTAKTVNVLNRESLFDEIKTIISVLPDIEFKQVVLNCDDSLKSDILSSEIALPVIKMIFHIALALTNVYRLKVCSI